MKRVNDRALSQREITDQNKNQVSLSAGVNQFSSPVKKTTSPTTINTYGELRPNLTSSNTKYTYEGSEFPKPPEELKDIRKLQAQLDLSKSKIETLQEELNVSLSRSQ